jgi:hypothetical protein
MKRIILVSNMCVFCCGLCPAGNIGYGKCPIYYVESESFGFVIEKRPERYGSDTGKLLGNITVH